MLEEFFFIGGLRGMPSYVGAFSQNWSRWTVTRDSVQTLFCLGWGLSGRLQGLLLMIMELGSCLAIITPETAPHYNLNMKSLLRLVGRLLFVTALLSSAAIKIKQPSSQVADFTKAYNELRTAHSALNVLPTISTITEFIPLPNVIRITGAVEGLIALLIFFGDALGGVLLLCHLVVTGVAVYTAPISKAIASQKVGDLLNLLPKITVFLGLVGFSLVFMNRVATKNSPVA